MKQQLELGLECASKSRNVSQRPRRSGRAHWWFDQMRKVVTSAVEAQPILPPSRELGRAPQNGEFAAHGHATELLEQN